MTTPCPDPDGERARLRAAMRERRAALPAAAQVQAARGVCAALEGLPAFADAVNVAGYWAVAGELPLAMVVAALHARGQAYWLPVVGTGRKLSFARWSAGEPLESNRFGIPQPAAGAPVRPAADLDLVLLPLLAFDAAGNRLGMGGGFYDASFGFLRDRQRPARPLLVGVAHAFQQVEALAAQPWDVRLDHVATEQQLIPCHHAGSAA